MRAHTQVHLPSFISVEKPQLRPAKIVKLRLDHKYHKKLTSLPLAYPQKYIPPERNKLTISGSLRNRDQGLSPTMTSLHTRAQSP